MFLLKAIYSSHFFALIPSCSPTSVHFFCRFCIHFFHNFNPQIPDDPSLWIFIPARNNQRHYFALGFQNFHLVSLRLHPPSLHLNGLPSPWPENSHMILPLPLNLVPQLLGRHKVCSRTQVTFRKKGHHAASVYATRKHRLPLPAQTGNRKGKNIQ
jgi:hypothetical protein